MYPGYTPCASQKQPKGVNVEVPKYLEFNLASTYFANSCARSFHNFVTFKEKLIDKQLDMAMKYRN